MSAQSAAADGPGSLIFQLLQRQQIRLRTSWTDRVGDRGTPEVEGQVKRSAELTKARAVIVESTKLRLRGGMQIITLDVEASESINNVKAQLERSMRLIPRKKAQIRRAH